MITCSCPGCGRTHPPPPDLYTWYDCPCGTVYLVPDDPADICFEIQDFAESRGVAVEAIRFKIINRFADTSDDPAFPFWTHLYWLWVENSVNQPVVS
jgi:hypothetical protein